MSRSHERCPGAFLSAFGCSSTIFRNHENWPRHDVSVHQMTMPEHKIFVLAHNASVCFIIIIKTWCEAISSRSPGEVRLPKCPCVTFRFLVLDFGMFSGIIMVMWPPLSKSHLRKVDQHVRSPWVPLIASRSQNRP